MRFVYWDPVFIATMQTSPLLGTHFFNSRQDSDEFQLSYLQSALTEQQCQITSSLQEDTCRASLWSTAAHLCSSMWRPSWVIGPPLASVKTREEDEKGMTFHSLIHPDKISFSFQPTVKNVLYCLLYSRHHPYEANRRQVSVLLAPVIKKPISS